MADSAGILLDAVQTLLKGKAVIAALVADRVYLAVPPKPAYPYILVTATSAPFSSDTMEGMEHTLRVQSFARENRPGTVLSLRSKTFDALNRKEQDLLVQGLVLVEHEGLSTYFPEEDGRTFQSVIEFKVLIN